MANATQWTIWTEGGQHTFTGSRDEVVAHLEVMFPGKHVEAFTDQVLVYEPETVFGDEMCADPIASAVPA